MKIRDEYFEWLCNKVKCDDYYELLGFLYNTDFTYVMPMDENRLLDGVELRYRFSAEQGYTRLRVDTSLDPEICSIFEVMVALALRMEETIFGDDRYGDRTHKWFWNMVGSLGLIEMNDDYFEYDEVYEVIETFLNRYYDRDGYGSLFYIPDIYVDMRGIEIWSQMCLYADVILGL